jgi:hypothetical protein
VWPVKRDHRRRVVTGAEEGQALGMVPVQVPQEYAALKAAVEEGAEAPDAGAGVYHQAREGFSVVGEGEAGRMASVAQEIGPGGRRGATGPQDDDFHPAILPGGAGAPVFLRDEGDLAPGMARGQGPVGGGRLRQRVGGGDYDLEHAFFGPAQQVHPGRRP